MSHVHYTNAHILALHKQLYELEQSIGWNARLFHDADVTLADRASAADQISDELHKARRLFLEIEEEVRRIVPARWLLAAMQEQFQIARTGNLKRPSAAELLDAAFARERVVAHVGHVDPANSRSPLGAGPDFRIIRGGRLNCACNGTGFLQSPGAAIRCACVRDDEEIPF